jgi:chromosome segregation ATPase
MSPNIIELAAQAEAECRRKQASISTANSELDQYREWLRSRAKERYDADLQEIDEVVGKLRAHINDSAETLQRLRTVLAGDEQ